MDNERREREVLLKRNPVHCGRDKSMPNGWSFNWASVATRERERERES